MRLETCVVILEGAQILTIRYVAKFYDSSLARCIPLDGFDPCFQICKATLSVEKLIGSIA